MNRMLYTSYCNTMKQSLNNDNLKIFFSLLKKIGPIERLVKKDNLKSDISTEFWYTVEKLKILFGSYKYNNIITIFCMNIIIHIMLNNIDFLKKYKKMRDMAGIKMLHFIENKNLILLYDLSMCEDTLKLCYTMKNIVDNIDNVM